MKEKHHHHEKEEEEENIANKLSRPKKVK